LGKAKAAKAKAGAKDRVKVKVNTDLTCSTSMTYQPKNGMNASTTLPLRDTMSIPPVKDSGVKVTP
jgi:hypothetical protein